MKLKPEHYKAIKDAIQPIAHKATFIRLHLANDARIKDMNKRVRWEFLHAAKGSTWLCDNVYPYANDDHIDTALRRIQRELSL